MVSLPRLLSAPKPVEHVFHPLQVKAYADYLEVLQALVRGDEFTWAAPSGAKYTRSIFDSAFLPGDHIKVLYRIEPWAFAFGTVQNVEHWFTLVLTQEMKDGPSSEDN